MYVNQGVEFLSSTSISLPMEIMQCLLEVERREEGIFRSTSFPLPTTIELFNKLKVETTLGVPDLSRPHASGRIIEEQENNTGPELWRSEFEEREGEAEMMGVEDDKLFVRGLTSDDGCTEGEFIGVSKEGMYLLVCTAGEFSAVLVGVLYTVGVP